LFVLLCLYAGLRREEALGLMWQNVHLQDNPHIDVRHTVTFDANGNPLHSESLKTKAAYRTVTIPPVLADALRAARIGTDSLLVIPAMKSGTAMSLSSFRKMWNHVPRLAGFPLTPHLLRHTYITRLCSARLDPKKIQYLAGHEDVYMTLRIYAHATDTAPEEMSPIISEIFSRSC
jgi:integrase